MAKKDQFNFLPFTIKNLIAYFILIFGHQYKILPINPLEKSANINNNFNSKLILGRVIK